MSDNQRRTNPFDPTDERAKDPFNSGTASVTNEVTSDDRPQEPPRRYEPDEEFDPALPNNDPTLNTKI
jgi:hypothetical protein